MKQFMEAADVDIEAVTHEVNVINPTTHLKSDIVVIVDDKYGIPKAVIMSTQKYNQLTAL